MELKSEHYTTSFMYLIEQTNAYMTDIADKLFKNNNIPITFNEYKALDTLVLKDGICQLDLSKLILKDRSFTSRIVDSLEERGMIERRSETKNKRLVKNLYVTEKGHKLINDYFGKLKKVVEDTLDEVSNENIDIMENTLKQIQNSLSKVSEMRF